MNSSTVNEQQKPSKRGFLKRLVIWHEYLDAKWNRRKYQKRANKLRYKMIEAENLRDGFWYIEHSCEKELKPDNPKISHED